MNLLIRHAEYLLGRRNCVVLPGLGALICATDAARFDQRQPGILLPPHRRVAFNSAITADDGLLAASFSRGLGISMREAEAKVGNGIEALRQAVLLDGSASFGRMGFFRTTPDGNIAFSASQSSPINATFDSLPSINIDRLKSLSKVKASEKAKVWAEASHAIPATSHSEPQETTPVISESTADGSEERVEKVPQIRLSRWRRLRNGASGIAASLAVLVTITLFLLNPIRMANEPQKASIAPIPSATSAAKATTNSVAERITRRLTIGRPAERGYVEVSPAEIAAREALRNNGIAKSKNSTNLDNNKPKAISGYASSVDRFCVIVASFPTMSQANRYIAEQGGGDLKVLEKDGKCRIYAATAPTYEAANALRSTCGVADAWVCRR